MRFLARRIAALPLLLVLSYRDALGVDHPLSPVLGDLVSAPDARRLQLTPLSRSAVAALARRARARPGRRAPPDRRQPVLRQPDPRPAGLPAARRASGTPCSPASPGWPRRPGTAWSCSPARPNRSSGELLARPRTSRPTTIGVLAATGLVDRHGRGVAFRHEIARSAVLDATAPGAEPALHAAMIDALEAVGGDAERARPPRRGRRRRRPDPALRARRGGRGLPLRGTPGGRRLLRDRAAPRRRRHRRPARRPARGPVHGPVPHRPARATPSRRGSGRWSCARELGRSSRSAPRTPRSPASRGTRPTAPSPSGTSEAAIEILSAADDRRALGFALARHAFLAAQRGDAAGGAAGGGPGGADRRRAGRRRRAAQHRVHRGRGGAPARRRPARRGPTCSRPPTSACGTGSTTWRRRR